ncbi:hypothetical protein A0H81_08903 [Grifola frondosa]|uniref:Uncharacterized protein n=1 Tax=Grifola frondosa TaxID=5627 RepID=A0A1C7M454_GRIFR|nr:hypothetical protein A0H81_08903 [Grifola frondosa]
MRERGVGEGCTQRGLVGTTGHGEGGGVHELCGGSLGQAWVVRLVIREHVPVVIVTLSEEFEACTQDPAVQSGA